MSHLLAARCVVCGVVDDPTCPECGTPAATTHGTCYQRPYRTDLVYSDGRRHEWHPECLTAPTTETRESAGEDER